MSTQFFKENIQGYLPQKIMVNLSFLGNFSTEYFHDFHDDFPAENILPAVPSVNLSNRPHMYGSLSICT